MTSLFTFGMLEKSDLNLNAQAHPMVRITSTFRVSERLYGGFNV